MEIFDVENLVQFYKPKIRKFNGSVFDVFSQFFKEDLSHIEKWLAWKFEQRYIKCNNEANRYLKKAEDEEILTESLQYYHKALLCAIPDSCEYIISLFRRANCNFKRGYVRSCLKDIERALNIGDINDLTLKLLKKKAECLYLLDSSKVEDLNKFLNASIEFLKTAKLDFKELEDFSTEQLNFIKIVEECEEEQTFELAEGENPSFAFASNKVKVAINEERGRHVIASKPIKCGDVLFIEKPMIFASIFTTDAFLIRLNKCCFCLRTIQCGIPCKSCSYSIYCDDDCRIRSWQKCHEWECAGMEATIWYDLGLALPALRALILGLQTAPNSEINELEKFGDKTNNYPYFNRLLSHLYRKKNVASFVVMAATTVIYLKTYTNFFQFILKHENCPKDDMDSLIVYSGGLLAKHMGQLACNSTTIEHCENDVAIAVASAIYPSTSLMNHSCKANITSFFIRDLMIVKAAEDISEGQEVYNCYGIDYREMTRSQRKLATKNNYYFECKCEICEDSDKELVKED